MPRQLPWLKKRTSSLTQVKQPPKLRAGGNVLSDIDDDFFDGTILASSRKGKGKAVRHDEDSGDDFPDLQAEPSTPHTRTQTQDALRKRRAPSSSPPPIQDYVQPQVEYMRTGASKFDLRDDEWMMVEDEFLEMAKLFTRHLHIAEYEKLKDRIEAKKKEQVETARSIVLGGKMSAEGAMRKKAELQEKRQRKAIQDVFASQNDIDNDEDLAPKARMVAKRATPLFADRTTVSTTKHPAMPSATLDDDSDDLDASRPHFRRPTTPKPEPKPSSALDLSSPTRQSPALPTTRPTQAPTSSLPTARQRAAARKSRATPFDMLDDYKPRSNTQTLINGRGTPSLTPSRPRLPPTNGLASTTPVRSSSPVKSASASTGKKVVDLGDDIRSSGSAISKATAERIAKRKAEREKEREGSRKKKGVAVDDIPTFLF